LFSLILFHHYFNDIIPSIPIVGSDRWPWLVAFWQIRCWGPSSTGATATTETKLAGRSAGNRFENAGSQSTTGWWTRELNLSYLYDGFLSE
jgi:hypothetical protein